MNDKKIIVTLALCVILAAIAGRMIIDSRSSMVDTTNTVQTSTNLREEYVDLPEENVVVRESASAVIDRFNEGSGVIFLGFKECPWCQRLLPIVNEAAAAEGEKVYYLDIKAAREENSTDYQQLVTILESYLTNDEDGKPRIYVPDVSIVKDGKIIGRYEMEATDSEDITPADYWTEERKERARQTLGEQMRTIKEEKENEGV